MTAWEQVEPLCKRAGISYLNAVEKALHSMYIFSGPDYLIWAEPVDDEWQVWLAIGENSLPMFINALPFWLPKYSYIRLLRHDLNKKSRNLEKLCIKLGVDPEPLKKRQRHD